MGEQPQLPSLRIQVTPPPLPPNGPHKTVPGQRSLFQQDFLTLDRCTAQWKSSGSPFRNDKAADLFIPAELQDPIQLPHLPGFSNMTELDNTKMLDSESPLTLDDALEGFWAN